MDTPLEELYPELPGSSEVPPPPRELLDKIRQQRGNSYRPRTRHLRADGFAKYTNRLFLETSPYLLQHAHNPVNWFPWGDEAFNLARELDRPLLVSIGYATCHWCHVMEEQSFEDEEIARFLNEKYIAVKVDREERPDVDAVYMTALHAMGSHGGWPLNIFVTPDREPFYGGTYFPPNDHQQGIGFLSLLKRLHDAYRKEPERVRRAGGQLTEAVRGMLQPAQNQQGSAPEEGVRDAIEEYVDRFDKVNGGVIGAPKFPSSLPVRLLLRDYRRSGDSQLLAMAQLTLRRMAEGGIYDQVGGGFHRYATDSHWMIPHFEKMLYDNALLVLDYLEGYQATGDEELARIAREILRYLQRDMRAEGSAFYAATDADSLTPSGAREEGYFFTWTPEELAEHLDEEQRRVLSALWGITRPGNFEGRNIPHRATGMGDVACDLKLSQERVAAIVEEGREILYRARNKRPLPLRDEKILSSWNGLAISAFARAGFTLADAALVEQAERCAGFLLREMCSSGRLAHSYQDGGAKGEAFLDDYAFVIGGLIDLFEATGEVRWLESSMQLTSVVQEEFHDQERGGYFMTGVRHEKLIAREKPSYDGVVPSGNSAMAMNLLRLHAFTEEPAYLDQAKATMDAFAAQISSSPTAFSDMLLAVDFLNATPCQAVIVTQRGHRRGAQPFLEQLRRVFLPNRVLLCVSEGDGLERASELVPLLRGKDAGGAAATAYYCENRSCRLPTCDPEEFGRQLRESPGR